MLKILCQANNALANFLNIYYINIIDGNNILQLQRRSSLEVRNGRYNQGYDYR